MQSIKKLFPVILVVALVGAGAFYGGIKYDQSKNTRSPLRTNFQGTGNFLSRQGGRNAANFASGDIISIDAKSMTVKLANGGSKIIFFSDSTKIEKSISGTATDLATGQAVTVNGNANQDGSITATSIQIRNF